MKHDKLNAAIALARAGFSVFPLIPNGKRPLIENWRNLATTDESTICQWWAERSDANIGVQTDRLLVIDIDPRKGGGKSFEALALYRPFPKTARVSTPSGGDHLYYKLPENIVVRGGVNVLGDGIDIRSYGGLAAAPGSAIDRTPYEWGNNNPIAVAPEWLIEQCRKPRQRNGESAKRVVAEDDTAVQLAWRWMVDHAPEANEGNRDDTGFKVGARFYDFGVTFETCLELLQEWNATKCHPSLEAEDIERLARSAGTNRDNAIGNRHPEAPGFEAVTIAERSKPVETGQSTTKFLTITAAEASKRALKNAARPLVKGLLDRLALSCFYGPPGSGKSFLGLSIGYHIGKGVAWAGMKVIRGAVVYVAAEGGEGIFARLAALEKQYGPLDDCALHILAAPVDLLHTPRDAEAIVAEIKRLEALYGIAVELVIIDTVARALAGGDENSGQDMGALIQKLDRVRTGGQCHVMAIHHTGKDESRGARGHSSLLGAVDTQVEIKNGTLRVTKQRDMTKDTTIRFRLKATRIGVDQDGDDVTSCYVEIAKPGDPEVMRLTGKERELFRAICKKQGDNLSSFDVEFAEVSVKADSDTCPGRSTLGERLSALTEKCRLRKTGYGEWEIVRPIQLDAEENTTENEQVSEVSESVGKPKI